MLKTEYTLPFVCEVPRENPWDGRRAVQLCRRGSSCTGCALGSRSSHATRLEGWAAAVNAGTFGVAPVSPNDCDCVPEDVQTFEDEIYWPLEKCRFHPAALECLVALCAALHHEAPIDHCRID